MPQVVYKDGSAVPPDKVASAIASGEAFTSADKVQVRNQRTGEVGTIDPGELAHATHYSVLTDDELEQQANHEKYGTLGQQALTGVEGAARGATIGLSDVATTGLLGDEYRKGAKARQAENPTAAIGGEIAGAIAPAILSGGTSAEAEGAGLAGRVAAYAPSTLVSRAGGLAERGVASLVGDSAESVLGRMAQRAAAVGASGAVEGGLYGAGSSASEAALDGAPITAEKVLSGFGHGALFGGGIGAGLGAAGGFGSATFDKIVGGSGMGSLRDSAQKLANESALKATGFQGSDFRKLIGRRAGEAAEDKIADVGQELLNYTFDSGPLKGQKLFTGAKKAEDFVDDLSLAKGEVGKKLGVIKSEVNDAALQDPSLAPDMDAYFQRVQQEVIDPLRASLSPSVRKNADKVEAELASLRTRANAAKEIPPDSLDVNVGAFDQKTMRPESLSYLRSAGAEPDRLGIPRIEVYPGVDGAPETTSLADGRHRLQLAYERGDRAIDANVVHFDADGNMLSEATQKVSLSNTPSKYWREAVSSVPGKAESSPIVNEAEKARLLQAYSEHGLDNKFRMVPISDIREPGTFMGTSGEAERSAGLRRGKAMTPVELSRSGDGKLSIDDGAHRISAAREQGYSHVPAIVPSEVAHLYPEALAKNGASFSELDKFRQDLRSVFQPPRPSNGGLPAPVPEHAEHLEKAERLLAEELDRSVGKYLDASGKFGGEYKALKKTYGALSDIEKVANKAAAQQLGNRAVSLSDQATGLGTAIGMMLTGNVGAAAAGGAAAIAHKLIRERGRSVLAVMADSVARMDGRITAAADTLAGIAKVPRHVASELTPSMVDRFDKTSSEVKAFASNPQAAAAMLAKPVEAIAPVHPQLAAQMQQTLAGDYQYLGSQLPRVMTRAGSSLTPQLEKGRVPRDQRVKFMSIVTALENPASVIEKVAHGELPRVQLEALKARRPEIFNQMRTATIKAFASAKSPQGFLQRTRISIAFGFTGDASLDPATLAAIQASNRLPPIPEDPPATAQANPPPPHGGDINSKATLDMTTPSQKAIGG